MIHKLKIKTSFVTKISRDLAIKRFINLVALSSVICTKYEIKVRSALLSQIRRSTLCSFISTHVRCPLFYTR